MSENRGGMVVKGLILLGFLAASLGTLGVAGLVLSGGAGPADPERPAPPEGAVASPEPTSSGPAAGASSPGAAVERVRARGVLLVATDTGEPPYSGTPPMYFTGATGEPDGFDVALARRVADAVGVKDLKFVHGKYSELEDLLLDPSGRADLLLSGFSPDDRPGLSWSEPYLEFGLCLVVPAASPVKTTADLFGQPVGIFDDDAAAAEVKSLVKGYTELVRLQDGYWDQLLAGRFAGFLYDYPYASAELAAWYRQNPSRAGSLRIAQYNLTDSVYAVGVRSGEPDLLAAVNRAIADWRASEAYPEAVRAHLSGGQAVEAPVQGKVHVVKAGESLSQIAAAELGSVDRWEELWKANRDRFPNPHLIEVGAQVVIP